jgi:aspartate ammonia-lyase
VLEHYMETTVGIVTALNPILGYEKATELAQEAYSSGKGYSRSFARSTF